MIKARLTRLAAAALAPLAALAIGLTPSSAYTTTADGSCWTNHCSCSLHTRRGAWSYPGSTSPGR